MEKLSFMGNKRRGEIHLKRVTALLLVATLVIGHGDWNFGVINSESSVLGATVSYSDSDTITTDIIPDAALISALKKIVNNGNDITVQQLKNYAGKIDLSKYTSISDVTGLGIAENATEINLAGTAVKQIPEKEFYMKNLQKITLPEGIERIENNAFKWCYYLTEANFPQSLTYIGDSAFECAAIESIVIPANVTNIGKNAFRDNVSLQTLEFEDFPAEHSGTMTKVIGNSAFSTCNAMTSLVFPTANENNPNFSIEIGERAFCNCSSLSGILTLPANVTKIGEEAFYGCAKSYTDWSENGYGSTMVKKYVSSYDVISTTKFSGAEEYTVFVPGDYRFHTPTKVYIDPSKITATKSESADKLVYTKYRDNVQKNGLVVGEDKMINHYIRGIEGFDFSKCTRATFGSGVCYSCYNLKTVKLPSTLTVIPSEMFMYTGIEIIAGDGNTVKSLAGTNPNEQWYKGLETVEMSDNVTKISSSAFKYAYNYKFDSFPSKLEIIGDSAFEGCERLRNLTFGSSIKGIGSSAFANTGRKANNVLIRGVGLEFVDFTGASNLKYLGSAAFKGSPITDFELNKDASVVRIMTSTFSECQFLENVKFNDNLKSIEQKSFSYDVRLSLLTVNDSCCISSSAFEGTFTTATKIDGVDAVSENNGVYTYCSKVPELVVKESKNNYVVTAGAPITLNVRTAAYVSGVDNFISSVKIGNNTYTFNKDSGQLAGNENGDIIPTVSNKSFTEKGSDPVHNVSENAKFTAWIVNLECRNSASNRKVDVTTSLLFKLTDALSVNRSTNTTYYVDSVYNSCKDIILDETSGDENVQYRMSVSSTATKTIAPKFVATYDDIEMSDVPEWSVVSSTPDSLIDLNVTSGGKSATIKRKSGTGCGTVKIKIKAGNVEKYFDVIICAPASGITFSKSNIGLYEGEKTEYIATISYSSTYAEDAKSYPDALTFTSSDETIASVGKVRLLEDGTYAVEILGIAGGKTSIKAQAVASSKYSNNVFNVAKTGMKAYLKDSSGNEYANNSNIILNGATSTTFTYDYTEDYAGNEITCECNDTSAVTTTVTSSSKKVAFKATKKGKYKMTIYPSFGTKERDGITINIEVKANVNKSSGITLKNAYIKEGTTQSVFVSMKNEFYSSATADINMITEATAQNYKKITDNRIKFTSSDTSIATVDDYGNVSVVKLPAGGGSVTITCSAYNGDTLVTSATATVYAVTSVLEIVTYSGITTIKVGDTEKITISYVPVDCRIQTATVTQSKSGITDYILNQDGGIELSVTGLKEGTNTITVTLKSEKNINNANVTKKVSIPITVVKGEELTTEAPTTVAPTTVAPTTEAPTTEAPTTEAPTTVAPTTIAEPQPIEVVGAVVVEQNNFVVKFTWNQTDEQIALGQKYKVYIDNRYYRTFSKSVTAEYTFKEEGEHEIKITAVLDDKQTPGVVLKVTIKNETTTVAPTTVAPTTEVPTTVAPTTVAPTTEEPTTVAPTTEEPTTVAPTTVAPTTVATTSEATTTVFATTATSDNESTSGKETQSAVESPSDTETQSDIVSPSDTETQSGEGETTTTKQLVPNEASVSEYDVQKVNVGKVKIKSAKRLKNKKKAKIIYKKVTGVTGYEIVYSTDRKFKKKVVKKVRNTTFVIGKLKKNKKYYVKVRAFINVGNKKNYGKWSKTKIIKK
jgi:hypothetical protein